MVCELYLYQKHFSYRPSFKSVNDGEDVEVKEPSYAIGCNVTWYSHYGEQHGGSLKN